MFSGIVLPPLLLHKSVLLRMPHIILFGACRIRLCVVIYKTLGLSMFLLLLFEPFSIAFETLQVMSWQLC